MRFRAAVLMLGCLSGTFISAAEPRKSISVGDKVPDLVLEDLLGKSWQLSELHQKAELKNRSVVVLTFWCSFCHSCRHVEAELDQFTQAHKGRAAVFALDSSPGETADDIAEFLKKKGLALQVLLDTDGSATELFGVKVTTTTVVIDADGVLRYCGQFRNGKQRYVDDAVEAVLAGNEVQIKTTPHRG